MRLGAVVTVLVLAASCSDAAPPVRTSIVTGFSAPRGLLDRAAKLELRVLEEATCDDAKGEVGEEGAVEISRQELASTGCTDNARFCGDLSVTRSSAVRVFFARALDAKGILLGRGCTTSIVDSETATVAIRMFRFLRTPVCGDGALQETEQCEPAGGPACDSECRTREILLSTGATGNNTTNGNAGDKTDPFFVWPSSGGDTGRFVAFYTDHTLGNGNLEVALRVMAPDLTPVASPAPLANGSFFLASSGAFPPAATPRPQSLPQAAFLDNRYYVAFQDDGASGTSGLDVHVRVLNGAFQSENLIIVNGSNGEPGNQASPAIAATAERMFVAWHDPNAGKIIGRMLSPPSSLGTQVAIGMAKATLDARPSLAAVARGWAVVWTTDAGVNLQRIGSNGTVEPSEQIVNEAPGAEGARVASLPDGRFAVVWSKGGDIFMQRFDASGARIAGDQAEPVNDVVRTGAQSQPAIAATSAGSGSYVVAWHDASSGHIRARAVGGTKGFLFNHVNGLDTEFQASRGDGRNRATPFVASGGSEPFVAIGWEDKSATSAGIYARRFPLPQ